MKVIIIDPGKVPETIDLEVSEDMYVENFDTDGLENMGVLANGHLVDSYAVARKFIEAYNKEMNYEEHPFVQRVGSVPWRNLGFYVDDCGRVDRQKANRKIIFTVDDELHEIGIAGRLVIVPDMYLDEYMVVREIDKEIEGQLKDFMHFNDNDGTNDLQLFTQEESDNLSGTLTSASFEDIRDFLKFLRGGM